MNFNSLINDLLKDQTVNELADKTNSQPEKVNEASQMILPLLLKKLSMNAESSDKAASLEQAVNNHKEDDVSDLQAFVKNVDTTEGHKMLGHILGSHKEPVSSEIAEKSGLDTQSIIQLMTYLAPVVMAYLANQKKEIDKNETVHSGGLNNLLGQLTTEYMKASKTDPSLINSIAGLFNKDSKNNKGIVDDLLGGLFK